MYSFPSRLLHWSMAALIGAAFALAWMREELPKGDLRTAMLDWHQWAGLAILILLAFRVAERFRKPAPALAGPVWQRLAARAVEGSLYVLMLVQPLLGWLQASLKGRAVSLFGSALPSLAAPDRGLAKQIGGLHETAGWVILALVALHVAATLYHRFWKHDDVLASMLGRRARAGYGLRG